MTERRPLPDASVMFLDFPVSRTASQINVCSLNITQSPISDAAEQNELIQQESYFFFARFCKVYFHLFLMSEIKGLFVSYVHNKMVDSVILYQKFASKLEQILVFWEILSLTWLNYR